MKRNNIIIGLAIGVVVSIPCGKAAYDYYQEKQFEKQMKEVHKILERIEEREKMEYQKNNPIEGIELKVNATGGVNEDGVQLYEAVITNNNWFDINGIDLIEVGYKNGKAFYSQDEKFPLPIKAGESVTYTMAFSGGEYAEYSIKRVY